MTDCEHEKKNNDTTVASRLDRIETKVDGIVEVVVCLARIEERSVNQHEEIQYIHAAIKTHSEKISELEKAKSAINGSRQALLWCIATALVITGLAISIVS